jgi:hypothetical protein
MRQVLDWDDLIVDSLVKAVVDASQPGADHSELEDMMQVRCRDLTCKSYHVNTPKGLCLGHRCLGSGTEAEEPSCRAGSAVRSRTSTRLRPAAHV